MAWSILTSQSLLRTAWFIRMRHLFVLVIGGIYLKDLFINRYNRSALLNDFYAVAFHSFFGFSLRVSQRHQKIVVYTVCEELYGFGEGRVQEKTASVRVC